MVGGVSRIAASLRAGYWDDSAAEVVPVALEELDATVGAFGSSDLYGWEFVDPPERSWAHWPDRLSLDALLCGDAARHVLDVHKETRTGSPRHLDLRVWFDDICVSSAGGEQIPLVEFIAGGRRWWDGLKAGDPRAAGRGIEPGPIPWGTYN